MKDVSQQLMLAKKGGVVTDGLVYWIDGRDGIITPQSGNSSLINHLDGSYLEVVKANGSTNSLYAIVGTDGFMKIDGAGSNFYVPIQTTIPINRTTELVLKISSGNTSMYMLGAGWSQNADAQIVKNTMTRLTSYKSTTLTGTYVHITCVTSGNTKTYRINNAVVATDNVVSTTSSILTRFDNAGGIYVGSFRVYNRALSEEEIMQNYNYEKALGRVPA